MPILVTFIQENIGGPYQRNYARKINKIHLNWKRINKTVFIDNILYIKNPKDSLKKKLLELISEFSKVTEYKYNTEISVEFLYTNNKPS